MLSTGWSLADSAALVQLDWCTEVMSEQASEAEAVLDHPLNLTISQLTVVEDCELAFGRKSDLL